MILLIFDIFLIEFKEYFIHANDNYQIYPTEKTKDTNCRRIQEKPSTKLHTSNDRDINWFNKRENHDENINFLKCQSITPTNMTFMTFAALYDEQPSSARYPVIPASVVLEKATNVLTCPE